MALSYFRRVKYKPDSLYTLTIGIYVKKRNYQAERNPFHNCSLDG
jgi:hypothetical protein